MPDTRTIAFSLAAQLPGEPEKAAAVVRLLQKIVNDYFLAAQRYDGSILNFPGSRDQPLIWWAAISVVAHVIFILDAATSQDLGLSGWLPLA